MTLKTRSLPRLATLTTSGHNLLEAIIATGLFIMVTVALSGIWVMYGRSLAKSGEVIAANSLARSVSEGLVANGWEFLLTLDGVSPLPEKDVVVERIVRGRRADIKYNVVYEALFNKSSTLLDNRFFSEDICQLTVTVRWNSNASGKDDSDGYNAEETYSMMVYKKGIK